MASLIKQAQKGGPESAPEPQQAAPEPQPAAPEQGQAQAPTPDEQKQYDLMVSNALDYIYDEKTGDTVIKMLGAHEPAQGIAKVVSMIGAGMKKAADNVQKPVEPEAMMGAATEIIEALIELGQAAGVFQFKGQEEVDQVAKEALMLSVKNYGEGVLGTQEGQALQGQAKELVQQEIQRENQQPQKKPVAGLIEQGRMMK